MLLKNICIIKKIISGVPGFSDAKPTIEFIRNVDEAFDLLNCKNRYGRGFKAAITPEMYEETEDERLNETEEKEIPENLQMKQFRLQAYLKSLQNINGTSILTGAAKTGFFGLFHGLEAIYGLGKQMLLEIPENCRLKFFLSFKVSQDHAETFFSCVRARNGCNNNPTAKQFVSAMKALLMHAEIKVADGNCELLGAVSILNPSKRKICERNPLIQHEESLDDAIFEELEELDDEFEEDDPYFKLRENVIGYISGFVTKMIQKQVHCNTCTSACLAEVAGAHESALRLFFLKQRGALLTPSADVTEICFQADKQIQLLNSVSDILLRSNLKQTVVSLTLKKLQVDNLFFVLNDHAHDNCSSFDTKIKLVSQIIVNYLRVKKFYFMKLENDNHTTNIRQKLNKIILFNRE